MSYFVCDQGHISEGPASWNYGKCPKCGGRAETSAGIDMLSSLLGGGTGDKTLPDDALPADWKVHAAHCCPLHGCKYGDDHEGNCPVVSGIVERDKNAGWCQEPCVADDPEACRKPGEQMPVPQEVIDQWDAEAGLDPDRRSTPGTAVRRAAWENLREDLEQLRDEAQRQYDLATQSGDRLFRSAKRDAFDAALQALERRHGKSS